VKMNALQVTQDWY